MQERLQLSVVLCTYNGETYILDQLISIARQDRLPDELVVVDDGSTDGTLSLVHQFASSVSFSVRVLINPQNIGSTKSFERAATACVGTIIVFADQDDLWREDRLTKTETYFQAHPDMNAVFSNAELIDGNSKPVGRRIWEEVQFTPEARVRWLRGEAYQILFFGPIVTGATLAIRRSVLPLVIPFPTNVPLLIHDAWIALITSLHGTIGFMEDCLIFYRQHAQQQVGFKPQRAKVTLRDRMTRGRAGKQIHVIALADRYRQIYDLLRNRPDIDPAKLAVLRRMQAHLTNRTALPPGRMGRIVPVARELSQGNYQLFGGHWWLTVIGDLLED